MSWQIHSEEGHNITLQIMDMAVESCCGDRVEIYDGSSASSPLLVKLTGSSHNGTSYYSSGSYMSVRFITDRSFAERGFQMRYKGMSINQ